MAFDAYLFVGRLVPDLQRADQRARWEFGH